MSHLFENKTQKKKALLISCVDSAVRSKINTGHVLLKCLLVSDQNLHITSLIWVCVVLVTGLLRRTKSLQLLVDNK